jgi:trk system potassium uptake protein TrkH
MTAEGRGTAGPVVRGQRPGDRRVRVGRERPQEIELRTRRRVRRPPSPAVVLVRGFLLMIAVGTVILMLPISSAEGTWTHVIDALFTATSAVCVTGLAVVDTATYWSPFGEVVLLVLIQLGGLGFMSASTLLLFVLVGRRTALRDRVLVHASVGAADLASATVVLRRVAVFTLIVEAIGSLILLVAFLGRGIDPLTSLWWGIFHGISAFNNAGFDITGGFRSLTPFADDALVLGTIAVLFILGGLGYAIVGDIAYKRRWSRLALETKLVVLTTITLLVGGTIAIALLEWSNPATLGALEPIERAWNAAFTSATARTAGFNSIDTGAMVVPSLAIVAALMFIGGASGSTAGGIKVNTFTLLLVAIVSTIRGDQSATALGRRVPDEVVYRALSVALLAVALVFVVALGLALSMQTRFISVVFEAVSAFGTVGLSTGITPELPDPARLLIIVAMFAGRLGPLTLVLALAARVRPRPYRPAIESIRIG